MRALAFVLTLALTLPLAGCSLLTAGAPSPSTDPRLPPNPEPSPAPPAPTRLWSDASLWPGGLLPVAGATVTIPAGQVVSLDVSPPPLAGLLIEGSLVFAERDLELTSDWIMVHGGFYIGSSQHPFEHSAVITLTGPRADGDAVHEHMGRKVLAVMDGVLEIYAKTSGPSWTRLVRTAKAGAGSIEIEDPSGWQAGASLVIASTDYGMWEGDDGTPERRDVQVEERTVTTIDGAVLTLDRPLEFMHYGQLQQFGGYTLDERAEVARLDRRVVIRGDAASADPASGRFAFGGHVMAMGASRLRLDGVEFTRLGQMGLVARYPVHFHLMGDQSAGNFVRHSSIHHNFNRCLTLHGSNGVLVQDVVGYDSYGHCFFLEDGAESGNVLRDNLALMIRKPPADKAILASDRTYRGPAGFWITNPDNLLVGNVAASAEGTGFWYALPEHPTGPSYTLFGGASVWPRRTPLGIFSGNVAHSNNVSGLHVDNGPNANASDTEVAPYRPRVTPGDPDSAPLLAVFENFTAYRHRHRAVWFRGDHAVLQGSVLADNAIGATFASKQTWVEDSAFIGESANLGTPRAWMKDQGRVGLDGRTLPRPWNDDPSFAIRGFEFYDGAVSARDSYFTGFVPNAQRQASALSFLDYTSFSMSPLSHTQGLRFGSGTQRLHLETRTAADLDLAADDTEDGYRSGLFIDQDGSLTGTAGRVVTVANLFLATHSCSLRPDWNAYVCGGRYASLSLQNLDADPNELAPVSITRNGAPAHVMFGAPQDGPNDHFRTLLPLDQEYRYDFSGAAPQRLRLDLEDVRPGDALIVSLPYGGTAPYIYRDWWIDARNRLDAAGNLAELRTATDAVYFHDGTRLYLRFQQQDDKDYAEFEVCRTALCR